MLHIHGNKQGLSHGDFPATLAFMQNRSSLCPLQQPEPPGCWGCALGPREPRGGEELTNSGKRAGVGSSCQAQRDQSVVTVTPGGRQDQQGSEVIGLPSASKALAAPTRAHPELGKGRQEVHSAELVLQDKVNGTHSTSAASAHPMAPARSPLHSLSCGLINLLQPCLHHHLLHTPTYQPGTSTRHQQSRMRSDPSSLPP